MTDWDLMIEYLNNAMQAMDKAHEASHDLRKNATPEAFDQFQAQMQELIDHLTALQTVLEHQETFALEELADRLSEAFGVHRPEYRTTPRMELDSA